MQLKSLKRDHAYDFLRRMIERGEYMYGEKLPSGKELAELTGVSHLTMRRALERLEQNGFITQIQGRGIFVKQLQCIREALVLLDYANDIHAIFPLPIQNALLEAGYVTTLFDIRRVAHNPRLFREVVKSRCDLLLFDVSLNFPWELLDDLPPGLRKINFHRSGGREAPFPCSSVLCDHQANGRAGMEALLQRGCRRVALFTGPLEIDSPVNRQFFDGALEALHARGLEPVYVYHHDDLERREIDRFFRDCDGCLAILDSLLVQLCRGAEERGIAIPGECLLVGRNNTPWAQSYHLTSVDPQPQLLAEKLLQAVNRPGDDHHCCIPPAIVWRDSCPESVNRPRTSKRKERSHEFTPLHPHAE